MADSLIEILQEITLGYPQDGLRYTRSDLISDLYLWASNNPLEGAQRETLIKQARKIWNANTIVRKPFIDQTYFEKNDSEEAPQDSEIWSILIKESAERLSKLTLKRK